MTDAYLLRFASLLDDSEFVAWGMRDDPPEDPEVLAQVLVFLRKCKQVVGDAEKQTEALLAKAMPGKVFVLDGVGSFERRRKAKKTTWDHEGLFSQMLRLARDPKNRVEPLTGELIRTPEETLLAFIRAACAPSYWRVKELAGLDVDADGFREVEQGDYAIQITAAGS